MAKLWDKGTDLDAQIEQFTVGEDTVLDRALIEADVLGSIAHAEMLSGIHLVPTLLRGNAAVTLCVTRLKRKL